MKKIVYKSNNSSSNKGKMKARRTFIKTLARGVLFSGMVGLGGALLLRENTDETQVCDFDFICRNCKKKTSCELPEAHSHRQNSNGNS